MFLLVGFCGFYVCLNFCFVLLLLLLFVFVCFVVFWVFFFYQPVHLMLLLFPSTPVNQVTPETETA